MTDNSSLRKRPTTARGQRRVTKILDAAAELIVEMGYADITTNHIANRAETSVGSLYQYFGNKDVVLEALADRYHAQLQAQLDVYFDHNADLPLPDLIASFIDGTLKFYTHNPGFEPLFFGAVKSESLEAIGQRVYMDMVGMIQRVLARHLPDHPSGALHIGAHLVITLCKLQLPHRHNLPTDARSAYVAQVKSMARAYIAALQTGTNT